MADEDVGRVFLLSQNELREPAYGFASDSKTEDSRRMATATDYAIRRGLWVNAENQPYSFTRSVNDDLIYAVRSRM